MNKKSKTRYAILGLLSDRSLSGYDIRKVIERRFHFFWSESYGQIYPELKRLLADKLIRPVAYKNADRKKGGKTTRFIRSRKREDLRSSIGSLFPPRRRAPA